MSFKDFVRVFLTFMLFLHLVSGGGSLNDFPPSVVLPAHTDFGHLRVKITSTPTEIKIRFN